MNNFIIFHYGNIYTGKAMMNRRGMLIANTIQIDQNIEHLSYGELLGVCYHFDKSNMFDVEILPSHLNESIPVDSD